MEFPAQFEFSFVISRNNDCDIQSLIVGFWLNRPEKETSFAWCLSDDGDSRILKWQRNSQNVLLIVSVYIVLSRTFFEIESYKRKKITFSRPCIINKTKPK